MKIPPMKGGDAMKELPEFFLIREDDILTKSYESESLIEAGRILSKQTPHLMFGVKDKDGIFIWQGKNAPKGTLKADE